MSEISIENIGPIERLSIPVPEGGGVVVLRGPNGIGKSKALDAVDKLTSGEGKLDKRVDIIEPGVVEGFGATIKVASRTSRAGDLEVVRLEDQTCIADLVDPQMKDPAASDRHRLKALLRMTKAKLDITSLYDVIGGKARFDAVVRPTSLDNSDAVEAAALIKRDFEAAARQAEKNRDNAIERAAAIMTSIEDIDLDAPHDTEALRQTYSEADQHARDLKAARKAADEAATRQADAKAKAEQIKSAYKGPTADEARIFKASQLDERDAAKAEVDKLRALLKDAEHRLDMAEAKVESADHAWAAAQAHESHVAELVEIINAGHPTGPTDDEIIAADAAVGKAAEAVEQAGVIKRARAQKVEHDDYRQAASNNDREAIEYRGAASAIDDVLSRLIKDDRIRISDGRLVSRKGERDVFFHDLSPGERWTIALDIAVGVLGERGVMVVPQECWESLDPANRKLIADHVAEHHVTVITAEPDLGDLRAEAYAAE